MRLLRKRMDYIIFPPRPGGILIPMSLRTKGLVAIFVAAMLWGSAGVVAKLLFLSVPPLVAVFHRFGLASLLMLPLFIRENKPKNYIRDLLPLGLLNTGNVFFFYTGISLTTANAASILGAAAPLITALLSSLFIREHTPKHKLAGILIGLAGAVLIIVLPLMQHEGITYGDFTGNILLVGSLLSWTSYIVYSRFILFQNIYSSTLSTSFMFLTVTIASGIILLATRQPVFPQAMFSASYFGVLTFASIGITIVTFYLFQWGVAHVSAVTASLKEYIQLVVGVGLNAVILGEQFAGGYIVGSILIALGVVLATGKQISKKVRVMLTVSGE